MNGKQFAGSTYIEHAKYYEKEYAKHHQKQYQEHHQVIAGTTKPTQWAPNPHFNALTQHISSEASNPNPLSKDELEYLFWNRLVELGWKKNINGITIESYQLMLVCPDCDKAIITQQSHTVSLDKGRQMSDKIYIKSQFEEHNPKCKPLEYDENGELVEAIPEATSVDEPVEGTVKYSMVDGIANVYINGTWNSITTTVHGTGNTLTASPMSTGITISPEAQAILGNNMTNWLEEHLETDYK